MISRHWTSGLAVAVFPVLAGFLLEPSWLGWLLAAIAIAVCPVSARQRKVGMARGGAVLVTMVVAIAIGRSWLYFRTDESTEIWYAIAWVLIVGLVLLWSFAGRYAAELPLLAALSAIAMMIATRSGWAFRFQGGIALASVVGIAMLCETVNPFAWNPRGEDRGRRVVLLTFFGALFAVTGALASGLNPWLPSLRDSTSEILGTLPDRAQVRSSPITSYVTSANLTAVTRSLQTEPQAVALTVTSERRPGYLRGRAYSFYRNGQWLNTELDAAAIRIEPRSATIDENGWKTFAVSPRGSGRTLRFLIENDFRRGAMFFSPLHTSVWLADSNAIMFDPHRVPRRGIDTRRAYAVEVEPTPAAVELDESLRRMLLNIPRSLRFPLSEYARMLTQGAVTTEERIERISRYLQDNFEYSLNAPESPPQVDPIFYLLDQRHPAHCEYFATAACLLLRSLDIPARYVTGYVVDEKDDEEEDVWIARNRHAHAWVEAYDSEQRQWRMVEATPGATLRGPDFPSLSQVATNTAQTDANDTQESVTRSTWDWESMRVGMVTMLEDLLRVPIMSAGCLLIAIWLFLHRQRRSPGSMVDEEVRQLDRVAARSKIFREAAETLDGFALRLDRQATHRELAERYRRVSRRLYQSHPSDWRADEHSVTES